MVVFEPWKDPRRHGIVGRREPYGCEVFRTIGRNPQNGHVLQMEIAIACEPGEHCAPEQRCDIRFGVARDAPQGPCDLLDGALVFVRRRDAANGRHVFHRHPATVVAISPDVEAFDQQRVGQVIRHRDDRVGGRLDPTRPRGRQTCRFNQRKILETGARRWLEDVREGSVLGRPQHAVMREGSLAP